MRCCILKNIFIFTAYFEEGDYNIIIFDWSMYSKKMYFQAIRYVRPLASHVAKMISFLVSHQMDPDLLTLVGHSLGAHIMGIAGYKCDAQIHQLIGIFISLRIITNYSTSFFSFHAKMTQ